VLATGIRHTSVDRALRYVGFGTGALEPLQVDADMLVTGETLRAAIAKDPDAPTILVLQAGDLCTGVYDRFEELIPIAHEHGVWVHVDGAIGLWAAASPKLRHLMAGAELADSWVTDGHKSLNVPYDSGYAFVADSAAHTAAVGFAASYIPGASDVRDPRDWHIEMSRRARGFTTYAAIRQLGRSGIAEMVERYADLAADLVRKLGTLDGVEVLWSPIINQGLVRFPSPRPGATAADHNVWTDRVIAAVVASGEAFFGGIVWNGMKAMRVSVSNWQTTGADIDRVVSGVERVLVDMDDA
jgi:glutamate/tyrosine decarboxylase-like PLP-dependent enzyme